MKRCLFVLLLLPCLLAEHASGQPLAEPTPLDSFFGAPSTACAEGAVLDDGTRELGYSWVPSVEEGQYVQEFRSSLFPVRAMETVCVCWLRNQLSGSDDQIDFEIVFYGAISNPDPTDTECPIVPDEEPYAVVPSTATEVPLLGEGEFYEVDVSGVVIPPGRGYIGVRWDASADRFFFLCADQSEGTPPVDGFFRDEMSNRWASVFKTTDPIFDDYRSLMIRAQSSGGSFPPAIPAVGPWGLGALAMLLACLGWRRVRQNLT